MTMTLQKEGTMVSIKEVELFVRNTASRLMLAGKAGLVAQLHTEYGKVGAVLQRQYGLTLSDTMELPEDFLVEGPTAEAFTCLKRWVKGMLVEQQ